MPVDGRAGAGPGSHYFTVGSSTGRDSSHPFWTLAFLLLLVWILHCHFIHRLDLVRQLMWISLDRLAQCNRQAAFLLNIPDWFSVQEVLFSSLSPAEGHRLLRSCLALYVDRKDLFLNSTAIRLGYSASGFSVPTPPLQPFLPVPVLPVALGQGGVWDDALEIEDIDSV